MELTMVLVASLFLYGAQPQGVDCSQHTAESLHSKSCPDSLIENDSGRIDDLHLPHKPAYHTYSRWRVSEQEYILAYWDQDNEVLALYADIYRENRDADGRPTYAKIATVPAFELVRRVFTQDLIGDGREQLIIISETGQLQAIRIMRIHGNTARIVLDTAGTRVKVVDKPKPAVLVYAKTPDQTEVFRWSARQKKFERIAVKSGPPPGDE
jgi:hypothetical protein